MRVSLSPRYVQVTILFNSFHSLSFTLFPACMFGDKCAYKYLECKFGLSCTKLGCVFSHPSQHCKYHPFYRKPACQYSHSMPVAVEESSHRAKFTWRRQDWVVPLYKRCTNFFSTCGPILLRRTGICYEMNLFNTIHDNKMFVPFPRYGTNYNIVLFDNNSSFHVSFLS